MVARKDAEDLDRFALDAETDTGVADTESKLGRVITGEAFGVTGACGGESFDCLFVTRPWYRAAWLPQA